MNHCYRLVWSHLYNTWVAVSETARARGKSKSSTVRRMAVLSSMAIATLSSPAFSATPLAIAGNALPTGGVVAAGSAAIASVGNVMNIHQASQRAVLNWQSFDIGGNATVNFNQPSSSAVALNRVSGNNASHIYGKLNANGHVFLLNPSGTYFAPGSQVNVGGLVASTLQMNDGDFMAGNDRLSNPGAGLIEALGTINANSVALVGNSIANSGNIIATTVSLVSGNQVAIDLSGNNLIRARITDPSLSASISNSGNIQAATVTMTAGQARDAINSVVNNTGTIRATTLTKKGGDIYLEAAAVSNSGSIDASGIAGGGTIMLMGDMQSGQVNVGGTLKAEALPSPASGRGVGGEGANGGFIETSAADVRIADGTIVSTLAANGKAGAWLIDPIDFTISSGGAAQTSSGMGADTLVTALNGGNVTITTDPTTGGNGDIFVNANINKTGATDTTLTLRAHRDIVLNGGIVIDSTSSKLGVTLISNISDTGGMIAFNTGPQILSNGGDIILTGGSGAVINGLATSGFAQGRDNTGTDIYGNGIWMNNALLDSAGGNIVARGRGAVIGGGAWASNGLVISANINSGSGKINLYGVNAGDAGSQRDRGINMGDATIISASSAADAITIFGDASTSAGLNKQGINAFNGWNTVDATGGGGITITGGSGAGVVGIESNGSHFIVGSPATTGNITIAQDVISSFNLNLPRTTGVLTFKTFTAGSTIGIAGGAGTLQLPSGYFNSAYGFSGIVVGDANTGTITTNSFNFNDNLTLWAGAANADIHLAGAIANVGAGASSGSLTVKAAGNVDMAANTTITTQSQAVVFNSDLDASNTGGILLGSASSISTGGGNITLGGGVAGNGSGNAVGNATDTDGIKLDTSATLNAGGGNIAMRGVGRAGMSYASGIYLVGTNTIQTSGAGTIMLSGTGGAGLSGNFGLRLGTGTNIAAVDGNIWLTGTGGASTGNLNSGIYLNAGNIAATGTGSITLMGTGGSTGLAGTSNRGVTIFTSALAPSAATLLLTVLAVMTVMVCRWWEAQQYSQPAPARSR